MKTIVCTMVICLPDCCCLLSWWLAGADPAAWLSELKSALWARSALKTAVTTRSSWLPWASGDTAPRITIKRKRALRQYLPIQHCWNQGRGTCGRACLGLYLACLSSSRYLVMLMTVMTTYSTTNKGATGWTHTVCWTFGIASLTPHSNLGR